MIYLFFAGMGLMAGLLSWFLQRWADQAYRRYRHAFKQQALDRMDEFFLFLDPAQLWLANMLFCVAAAAAAYGLAGGPWAGLAALAALAAPQFLIRRVRSRRRRRFDEQLPDMLMALSGALRAGSGLQSALRAIVALSPSPLGQELSLVLRQQRMGVALETALSSLYHRMPTEGAALFVSALKIAAHSGGGLAEALDGIAATLRARLHLLGRVRALTSQGRLQAWVMAGLPFALAVVLHYVDRDAMRALWETPPGWAVLALVVLLEAAGIVLIMRIVDIQV